METPPASTAPVSLLFSPTTFPAARSAGAATMRRSESKADCARAAKVGAPKVEAASVDAAQAGKP